MNIEHHSRMRQIELGKSLANRKKIYLDARFWIIARDASLGVSENQSARKLLYHLRQGVSNGQLVCPISAAMFLELMKQIHTETRRIGTAQLIDELSLGVTMVPSSMIMDTEIHAFLSTFIEDAEVYPMQELIWTKVAYVLGDIYPALAQLLPADGLAAQKRFFDHLWDYSLNDMVKTIGNSSLPPDRFRELSDDTNEKNAQHKSELRSFAQTYDVELKGVIEIAGDVAADFIQHLYRQKTGQEGAPTAEERANSVNMCRNLLYHALKKPETKDKLRSIHIGASIHAGMRWDKNRQFKPNDYYDFEHATAALSYCDVFLTECSLHHLVTRPQLNLTAVNDCPTFSDVDAAADYLAQFLLPG